MAPAKGLIARHMKQATMIASGYVIGHFVAFTTQRALKKHVAVPIQGMMYAAVSPNCQELARRIRQLR